MLIFLQKSESTIQICGLLFETPHVVFQMEMHESQHCPQETESEALDLMNAVLPKLIGMNHHPKFILNMNYLYHFHFMEKRQSQELE